jgi:shikimate kinase
MQVEIKPFILWLIGIPGAGKSTMAQELSKKISLSIEILDSDEMRQRITPTPTWSDEERLMFYNTIVEISLRLFKHNISSIIAASAGGVLIDDFRKYFPKRTFYVHLNCDIVNAFQRHPKHLYEKAQRNGARLPIQRIYSNGGNVKSDADFARINNIKTYELIIPRTLDLEINTDEKSVMESNLGKIIQLIK